jgi:hypothetical protein
MTRKVGVMALLVTFAAAGSAGAIAATGGGRDGAAGAASGTSATRQPLQFEAHDLYVETNATDGDAGLQMFTDAEEWRSFSLRDPRGKLLVNVKAKGRVRQFGLSELFVEASEPAFTEFPLSRFKKRFPAGRYRFRGQTVDGRRVVGSDTLTHVLPAGPDVTFPTAGAQVDPNGFAVTWAPVTRPAGVAIVTYQVIVDQGSRELSMYLPATATSATIPGEFLEPGTRVGLEVLARERSGNQTITEVPPFQTGP